MGDTVGGRRDPGGTHERIQEQPLHHGRWQEPGRHLRPPLLVVPALGSLQRHDRRDGQALPDRARSDEVAVCLGAVRALPRLLPDGHASRLARDRLGYKGGIISGLLMVAAGGFWFVPATQINALAHAGRLQPSTAFVGYLAGVCAIAAGLTFLETVANPYTTVLGPKRYAATRINLAQSCNGIGWIFGPIIGGMFFYSTDAAGQSTGSETLYIPYAGRGRRRRRARRGVLLRAHAGHQDRGRVPAGRCFPRGVPFDLEAPALRDGRARPVPLRGGTGRHLQLLHQLHDRGNAGAPGGVAHGPAAAVRPRRTRPGSCASATAAPPTSRRSASSVSWSAGSREPPC